jgi:hypothetical protein
MNFMEQMKLMDKLTPSADEIITNYNNGIIEFETTNKDMFDKHSQTILEIVGGAGISAEYKDGKVFINLKEENEDEEN